MGTRSLTIFEDRGEEICVLYRQMDGYPEGHGLELAEFLKDIIIVNGISMAEKRKIANGMSCLAAQVISHFKNGPGEFYLYPAGTRNADEEYLYSVTGEINKSPVITAYAVDYDYATEISSYHKLFEGDPYAMLEWIATLNN